VVQVTRTFTVSRNADFVVGYLADFSHAEQWDPGTVSCQRQDSGPVKVGSTWRNVSEFLGRKTELSYRLESLQPGHIVLVGSNKTATSTDDITVRDAPDGSEVTYQATIELRGLAKLGAPVVAAAMQRLGDKTAAQMQETIAHL
jgi:carbon monoxide dehydrogenase subunit G